MLGQPHFFAERLGRQREGRGILLVAWLDTTPVGDLYLWLEPAEEPEISERLQGVPLLNHLEVHEKYQNQGIGTELIAEAEALLRRHGHRRVALGVALDNLDAMRLYLRLGYVEWPFPPVRTTYEVVSDNG